MTSVADSVLEAVKEGLSPVYVVHANQAAAIERAQALVSMSVIPLMIIVPTFGYPFSKTIWVAVDRALLQHLDKNEALDEQFRGH